MNPLKTLLIMISIITLTSCSDDGFESPEPKSTKPTKSALLNEMESLTFTYKDVKRACEEGCDYDYRLYTIANSLNKKAVSLNTAQLVSIKKACNYFCATRVFSAIKREREIIENEMEEPKESEVKKVKSFDSPPEKKEKKAKSNNELVPFEDL